MGNSQSYTEVDSFVRSTIAVHVNATQSCGTFGNQVQNITIVGNNGNVNISNLDWSEWMSVNTQCMSSNKVTADTQQKIQELIKSTAKSINQALNFNPGSTDSEDITRLTTQIATEITESFNQKCVNNLTQSQSLVIKGDNKSVNLTMIKWSEGQKDISNCVQASASVITAINALKDKVDASSSSTVKNILSFLGDWGILIVVIAIVVIMGLVQGFGKILEPKFLVMVGLFVSLYVVAAFFFKGWPYKKVPAKVDGPPAPASAPMSDAFQVFMQSSDQSPEENAAARKRAERTDLFILLGGVVGTLVFGFLTYRFNASGGGRTVIKMPSAPSRKVRSSK